MVPPRHAANTAPPSAPSSLLMLPHPCRLQSLCSCVTLKICLLHRPQPPTHLIIYATYHAYAHIVPSQHASNAAPPSLPQQIVTLLQPHHLQSLCSCSTLNLPNPLLQLPSLCSRSVLPTCLQRYSHNGLILNATYHPYAPETNSR
ncbi:hypothetical protein O181_118733 [Austropuccinia psidii MF-1]|uniref:Uncharacterized protein n=1 Tax=Austropuccinia psidii MF-1 TaxID=1389203 RepID=A0A9Q3PYP8_9BASI|nr:hypothetical protein [Austropuccinia psidii MF-1]